MLPKNSTGTIPRLQSTPFVAYFVNSGELRHLSYVIISDCLHHNTTAIYLFLKMLYGIFLKSFLNKELQPKRIIYFTDVQLLNIKM